MRDGAQDFGVIAGMGVLTIPNSSTGPKGESQVPLRTGNEGSSRKEKVGNYGAFGSSLRDLPRLRDSRRRRARPAGTARAATTGCTRRTARG